MIVSVKQGTVLTMGMERNAQDEKAWADPNGPDWARFSQKDIDAAILVERERCGRIAEYHFFEGTNKGGKEIAARIRSGK